MKDLSIDIETMDTEATGAIVAIGATFFDPELHTTPDIGQQFYVNINLQSCLNAGRTVSGSTIMWWLRQSDKARLALGVDALPMEQALLNFHAWIAQYSSYETVEIWSHATFDLPMLGNSMTSMGLKVPWKYWNTRDIRTLKQLTPQINNASIRRSGEHHNALDDAIYQAKYISLRLQALEALKHGKS